MNTSQGDSIPSFNMPSIRTESASNSEVIDYQLRHNEEVPEGTQSDDSTEQPSIEQVQQIYYTKGQKELDALQLLDLSPLASWKLSSYKKGFGLSQLRNDSPETFWQSDGSAGNNMEHQTSDGGQLSHPHYVTLQFSKKVSLERISIFTNYQLDESYTPSKIKIMAGSSNWDLTEVCVVNFERPIGWSHIIFKGVRGDGLLKCFVVKIIILANHQDGKDSHIRAIRCFGKKPVASTTVESMSEAPIAVEENKSTGLSLSGISLNNRSFADELRPTKNGELSDVSLDQDEALDESSMDPATTKILRNVNDVLGFNSGFESLELKSISSIR